MSADPVAGTSIVKPSHVVLFGLLFVAILFAFTLSGFQSTNQRVWEKNDAGNGVIRRGGIPPNSQLGRPIAGKTPQNLESAVDSTQAREALVWRPKLSNVTKVIFLRIPKTGSRTLGSLVQEQVKKKGFDYRDFPSDVESSVRRDVMNRHGGRVIFAAHMHYMEFKWQEPPIYISVVRDPIARITSNFYFSLHGDVGNHTADYTQIKREEMIRNTGNTTIPTLSECVLRDIPFCTEYHRLFSILMCFCGEDPRCRQASNWTYARAVKHIDSSLAVGLSEEFEDYLRVLERHMPDLFHGIVKTYRQPQSSAAQKANASKTKFKDPLSPEAESKLRRTLELEYRIYNYARDRFHQIKKQLGIV